MVSFLVMAWICLFGAGFEAWDALVAFWEKKPWVLHDHFLEYAAGGKRTFSDCGNIAKPVKRGSLRIRSFVASVLDRMLNVQAVTSMGIVVAGFSQISSISYYHSRLVSLYWLLTLQSFLVVDLDYVYLHLHDSDLAIRKPSARPLVTAISNLLSISFMTYTIAREQINGNWDNYDGPCYRWLYSLWTWEDFAWLVLAGIAVAEQVLHLIPLTRRLISACEQGILYCQSRLNYWFFKNYSNLFYLRPAVKKANTPLPRLLGTGLMAAIYGFVLAVSGSAALLCWIFFQLLATFAVGHGFSPLICIFFVSWSAWTSLDIISLRVVNNELFEGGEIKMRFGQVLPLTLIVSAFIPGFVEPSKP